MKKLIMAIACLITMISANGQDKSKYELIKIAKYLAETKYESDSISIAAYNVKKELELKIESGELHSKKYGCPGSGHLAYPTRCVLCKQERLSLGDKMWAKLLDKRHKNWIKSEEYKEIERKAKQHLKQCKKREKEDKKRKEMLLNEFLSE